MLDATPPLSPTQPLSPGVRARNQGAPRMVPARILDVLDQGSVIKSAKRRPDRAGCAGCSRKGIASPADEWLVSILSSSLKEPVQCDLLLVNLFCSLGQFGRSEIILLWAA